MQLARTVLVAVSRPSFRHCQIDVHLSGRSPLSASLLTVNSPLCQGSVDACGEEARIAGRVNRRTYSVGQHGGDRQLTGNALQMPDDLMVAHHAGHMQQHAAGTVGCKACADVRAQACPVLSALAGAGGLVLACLGCHDALLGS